MRLGALLRNLNHLLTSQSIRSLRRNLQQPPHPVGTQEALFQLQQVRWKSEDRRVLAQSMPRKDMGTQGERGTDIDLMVQSKDDMFPTEGTPDALFDGIRFNDLPIVHIKSTPNNTIINVTSATHDLITYRSCGMEGFKNTRKGTNIAAQATAITVGGTLVEKGLKNFRVRVQGLGPGRMSSVKGLQMAGINIVSVTDNTHISYNPPRSKKARRI